MITIPVGLAARSYRILVGPGVLAAAGPELAGLRVGRRVAVVSYPAIMGLHGRAVVGSLRSAGFDTTEILLPEGERAKTLDVARQGWDRLLEAGCDRTSTVVALGGGAVGDLAGFVAATYMRGINFVQVPTTLLAQVDASIGGKTAIDHPRAKNLIGAFHQPRFVLVDPAVLTTLPEPEFRSGLAEVIKHGIVLDADYFADLEECLPALLRRDLPTLERVVAGFAAATYMRGVNLVQLPTTLLAQVDASSGGKTAIDHPRAKNLIGSFYQPRLVLADTAALLTLPERELRSGLAEVIKHGIVLDAAYFDEVERDSAALVKRDPATLERIVAGSCRLKASVVERDEQEAELRHVLNYGHTIGHAIEAVTGYRRFAHGEAVSLGIAAEAGIAERLGLAKPGVRARQVRLLEAVGLPVRGVGEAPSLVVEALSRDKKSRDGRVPFVLAPEIGAFRLVFDVPTPTILDALAELG